MRLHRRSINDYEVCKAVDAYHKEMNLMWSGGRGMYKNVPFPYEVLAKEFKCDEKVAYSAMERACDHGLIEYGISLRTGWLTDKGKQLLQEGDKD